MSRRRPVRCDLAVDPRCATPATVTLTRPSGLTVHTCEEHLELARRVMRHWVGCELDPRQAAEVAL